MVSTEYFQNWEKSGKVEFVNQIKIRLDNQENESLLDVEKENSAHFYKLIWDVLNEGLKVEQAVSAVKEIAQTHPDFIHSLCDLLSIIDIEVSCHSSSTVHAKFVSLISALLSVIPECLLKERMDVDVLENARVIPSKTAYTQKYVKTKTKLYYKQQKFNLLREESEGYAKLITELSQSFIQPDTILNRIQSLIGFFNLDPNRTMDILLDVFERLHHHHHESFVTILQQCSIDRTTLTHILGFKYHYYQPMDTITPTSLYHITATLLKHNLISLDLLLPHLYPSHNKMVESFKKEVADARKCNNKLNFAFLNDNNNNSNNNNSNNSNSNNSNSNNNNNNNNGNNSNITTSMNNNSNNSGNNNSNNNNGNSGDMKSGKMDGVDVKLDEKNEEDVDLDMSASMELSNQKLGLCEALIMIGCWEHAEVIMQSLPTYMAVSRSSISTALCRLIDYVIEPLYISQIVNNSELYTILRNNYNHTTTSQPPTTPSSQPPISSLPTTESSTPTPSSPYSFPASVKRANSYVDLLTLAFPLIMHLGPYLSTDTVLMVKINRLATHYLTLNKPEKVQNDLDSIFCGLMSLYDEVLLPSLSVFQGHCPLSNQLWQFIGLLKYENRYRLYWQWKNRARGQTPILIKAHALVTHKTKQIMKRIAKDNVKPLGRQIGKLSHTSPGVVFELMLSQIQIFNNLITPVVDSLRFLSPLSYDVLAYYVIEALANPERERLKTDGTNISTWLQSLASFSATVFKKYQVDMCAFTQYITNQLKAGKSYDLYILKEVIQKMAGIEVSEDATKDQLLSMTGGELLRQEGSYFSQVRNTKKTSNRLMDTLHDQNLTIPLCLLMAQQRHNIVFPTDAQLKSASFQTAGMPLEDKRPIKLITNLYDQCQDALVQYMSFIQMHTSVNEIRSKLPDLYTLSHDYYITAEVAFALWRSIYSADITAKAEELSLKEKKELGVVNGGEVGVVKEEKGVVNGDEVGVRELGRWYWEAVEMVMAPIRQDLVLKMVPSKLWEELNVQFYTTFWSLELYDLEAPRSTYEGQIKNYEGQLAAIEHNKEFSQSKKKKDKERERCVGIIDRLKEEMRKQQEHVDLVASRMKAESACWFQSIGSKPTTILQHCIFPRACFTDVDALYCAKFLNVMHFLDAPNVSSLICYDKIFTDLTWALASCTENEAHRYGRFLCAVLNDVMRWYSDKAIYDKECLKYSGFRVTVKAPPGNQGSTPNQLDYNNFRGVMRKWHYEIFKAASNFIESGEYTQIRNMLILLTKILPSCPKYKSYGDLLEKKVRLLVEAEKEKRKDLYILASVYLGQLKATSKTWVKEEPIKQSKNNAVKTATTKAATTTTTLASTTTNITTTTTASTTTASTNATSITEAGKADVDERVPRVMRQMDVKKTESSRIKPPPTSSTTIRQPIKDLNNNPTNNTRNNNLQRNNANNVKVKSEEVKSEKVEEQQRDVSKRDEARSPTNNNSNNNNTSNNNNNTSNNSNNNSASKYHHLSEVSPTSRRTRPSYEAADNVDPSHTHHSRSLEGNGTDRESKRRKMESSGKESLNYIDNRDKPLKQSPAGSNHSDHSAGHGNHREGGGEHRRGDDGRVERKRHSRNNQEFDRDVLSKRFKNEEVSREECRQEVEGDRKRETRVRERRDEGGRGSDVSADHKEVKTVYKEESSLRERGSSLRSKKNRKEKRGASEKHSKKSKERAN